MSDIKDCRAAYPRFSRDDLYRWPESFYLTSKGERLTCDEIDQLADCPEMDAIQIYGLRQDTFDYFLSRYGKQFKRIYFFKDNLVQDWSGLADLPDLECLFWYWNQRITNLWNMSNNRALKILHISDFTRLHDLSGIEKARSLRVLFVGDEIWSSMRITSLMPLAEMKLECLEWSGKLIEDQDCSFLPTLKQLRVFQCPLNYFTTEQCAWIAANCPIEDCRVSHAYEIWNTNGENVAAITGKRKPALPLTHENEARIRKYSDQFDRMKQQYASVPYREAFPEFFCQ